MFGKIDKNSQGNRRKYGGVSEGAPFPQPPHDISQMEICERRPMTKETQIQARHMPRENHEDGLAGKGGTRGKRRGCSLRAKARRKANAPVTGHRYRVHPSRLPQCACPHENFLSQDKVVSGTDDGKCCERVPCEAMAPGLHRREKEGGCAVKGRKIYSSASLSYRGRCQQ